MKNKILIIGDDIKLIAILKNLLQQLGYRVVEAYNGIMGYQFIEEEKPDLIISDMLLPGISGLELCRKIKETPNYSKIPVFLMTEVYKKLTYKLEAHRYGADIFIEKPINFQELIGNVIKFLPLKEINSDESKLFDEKLTALTAEFIKDLPEIFQKIHKNIEELKVNAINEEQINEIYRIVHSLSGTAGTYSFHSLSKIARSFLKFLDEIRENKTIITNEKYEIIKDYLIQMKNCYFTIKENYANENPEKEESIKDAEKKPAYKLREYEDTNSPICIVLFEKDLSLESEIRKYLEVFNFYVINLPNIYEMQKFLKENNASAIIIDLDSFDEIDDLSTIVNTIQQDLEKKIPTIFLSENDDFHLRLKAVRCGAETVIGKPIDYNFLIEKLDSLSIKKDNPDPYRILIVEDESLVSSFYQFILEEAGFKVRILEEPSEILEQIIQFQPDLILMDLYMPEVNGVEIASVIRQYKAYENIPLIYLSIETDVNKQLAAMNKGGDDFLIKPVKKEHLLAAVINKIKRFHNLRNLILKDGLTNLLNHSAIKEQLEKEIAKSKRFSTPLSFFIIDIDNFKTINDEYGHLMGDRVLKNLAFFLKRRLRQTDIVGRYGGDEFAIIFPNSNLSSSLLILEELKLSFAKIKFSVYEKCFSVSFSAGGIDAALCQPNQIISLADQTLYEAKKQGKNKILGYLP